MVTVGRETQEPSYESILAVALRITALGTFTRGIMRMRGVFLTVFFLAFFFGTKGLYSIPCRNTESH
jgi:hypothetical protein